MGTDWSNVGNATSRQRQALARVFGRAHDELIDMLFNCTASEAEQLLAIAAKVKERMEHPVIISEDADSLIS